MPTWAMSRSQSGAQPAITAQVGAVGSYTAPGPPWVGYSQFSFRGLLPAGMSDPTLLEAA